jgi:4-azaleucine resistance transporter AzlC
VTGHPGAAERREIATAALTLGAAVGLFGVVFGVGTVSAGGTVLQACVMSLLVFTGASQFSFVSEVGAGSTGASALGGAVLLAARNTVYGLAMSRLIGGSLGRRMVAAHLTIDESTAMATAQPTADTRRLGFWVTGVTVFVCWNVSTLIGAFVGSSIDIQKWGLDVAFPAGFVAMVMPHLRTRRGLLAGLVGALICLALVPFTPAGVPVLGAATAVLIGLAPEPEAAPAQEPECAP